MEDWFSGVYIKPMGVKKLSRPAYESSETHRHDFYYCVLLDKGKMELEVDFEKVQLTDHSFFLSYPPSWSGAGFWPLTLPYLMNSLRTF
jgi:AraC family transcriptional activator of pobA